MERRKARRSSWLDKRLRAHRWDLLGTAPSWAPHVGGLWLVVAASTLLAPPLARSFLLGSWTTIGVAGGWLMLALADGSLLARLARTLEEQVGDELRRAPGVYAVISGLPFEGLDVDHVVLARGGIAALEVKYLHTPGRTAQLRDVYGLAAKLGQTTTAARKISLFLRPAGVETVRPVLYSPAPAHPTCPPPASSTGASTSSPGTTATPGCPS
ncbi:nuclease-like protein [Motilibacter peucedani]|uniref:Nuclease-like protein n=1 Tax=Motilibacter peucedani TaxID=598650 RepID=A0A420XV00_9ACTN|nr:nuclease-related domain-containing protein [Motilibacter peucedani]RKS80570.1 nuclease-like protein [Motilibacter peucedani]